MPSKMFRERPPQQWKIVEKDLVDEIIFRTMKPRNRIMLDLMARAECSGKVKNFGTELV